MRGPHAAVVIQAHGVPHPRAHVPPQLVHEGPHITCAAIADTAPPAFSALQRAWEAPRVR